MSMPSDAGASGLVASGDARNSRDPEALAAAERTATLLRRLARFERLAVAYSGGVDSAVLLHAAHRALGAGAVGVIADSPSLPRRELEEARALAAAMGCELVVLATRELEDGRYVANAGNRCYFCKTALFEAMAAWARAQGIRHLAFGEITDDLLDDRPGARAAREFSVHAPLREAGFSKADVRAYARAAGLSVSDKPASACLASRLPIGTAVTAERLARIERSEELLRTLGLRELRVRDHGTRARVEIGGPELDAARSKLREIAALLSGEGFRDFELVAYVSPASAARLRAAP